MIILSVTLLAFAVADLIRWSPDRVATRRAVTALAGGTVVAVLVSGLGGYPATGVAILGSVTCLALSVWLGLDNQKRRPAYPLVWLLAVLVVAAGLSDLAGPLSGPLDHWYSNLAFQFVESVSVDQFVLCLGAGLFLLASANRCVRLVLEAAGTPPTDGEATLRGGRVLGPMERVFVGALVLSGNLTGAAVIIAAKGLLRLPEIRDSRAQHAGREDQVTEYFLIGTFSSLLLAGGLAAVVLAAA